MTGAAPFTGGSSAPQGDPHSWQGHQVELDVGVQAVWTNPGHPVLPLPTGEQGSGIRVLGRPTPAVVWQGTASLLCSEKRPRGSAVKGEIPHAPTPY